VECGIGDDVATVIVDGAVRMRARIIPGVDLAAAAGQLKTRESTCGGESKSGTRSERTAEQISPWSFPIIRDWLCTRGLLSRHRCSGGCLHRRSHAAPTLIPEVEPTPNGRKTLRRGTQDELVKTIQRKLSVAKIDGVFGPHTEAAVREFQRNHALVPDGIVGPKTWRVLDTVQWASDRSA
jgi:hypothetical protein